MTGLSDAQQAWLSVASAALIAVGASAASLNFASPQVGVILALVGAVGFGIKEALGSQPKAP